MEQKDLNTIVNELSERYKEVRSISFRVVEDTIGISVAKVRDNNTTAAQFDYIDGLKNVSYASKSTVRNASKAAASVIISVAKDNPNVKFNIEKQ